MKKRALADRMMPALIEAIFGYRIRNSSCRVTTDISNNPVSRDLKIFADAGLLIPAGKWPGRHCTVSEDLRKIRQCHRLPRERRLVCFAGECRSTALPIVLIIGSDCRQLLAIRATGPFTDLEVIQPNSANRLCTWLRLDQHVNRKPSKWTGRSQLLAANSRNRSYVHKRFRRNRTTGAIR